MKKILFLALCVVSTVFGANGVHRDSAKGIVIDTRTGLVWQDDAAAASTTATWANAITICENLVLGGYSDWRLPNINELKSIRDTSRFNPAIDMTFVNTATDYYWSSTSVATDSTYARLVSFYTNSSGGIHQNSGVVDFSAKGNSRYVRCVRGN